MELKLLVSLLAQNILKNYLIPALNGGQVEFVAMNKQKIISKEKLEGEIEYIPLWQAIIHNCFSIYESNQDNSFKETMLLLEEQPLIKAFPNGPYSAKQVLIGFLNKLYLKLRPSLKWEESIFDELSQKFINEISSTEVEYLLIAPLENFELRDCEEIIVSDSIKIKKLDAIYKEKHLNSFGTGLPNWDIVLSDFAIQISFRKSLTTQDNSQLEAYKACDQLLLAIRLFSPHFTQIIHKSCLTKEESIIHFGLGTSESGEKAKVYDHEMKFILCKNDELNLCDYFSQVRDIDTQLQQEWFQLALSLFSESYNHTKSERRMFDVIRALEIVFGGDGTEISYKTSLRPACFIGQTPDERKEIFKSIKKMYRCRNDYVHKNTSLDHQSVKLLFQVHRYLAQSLLKIIKEKLFLLKWDDKMPPRLDEYILDK